MLVSTYLHPIDDGDEGLHALVTRHLAPVWQITCQIQTFILLFISLYLITCTQITNFEGRPAQSIWPFQSLVGDWGRKVVFGLFQLLLQEELVLFLPLALSNNVSSPLYQPAAAAAAVKLLLWSEVLVNSHQGALLLIHWFFCCWRHTDCKVSTRNKILEGGMSWLSKRPWILQLYKGVNNKLLTKTQGTVSPQLNVSDNSVSYIISSLYILGWDRQSCHMPLELQYAGSNP